MINRYVGNLPPMPCVFPDYPAPVIRNIFPGGQIKSNFICAIGYGDPAGLFERLPRPDINEVCSFV